MVAELNIFSETLNKTEKFGEEIPVERVDLIGGSFNPPHIAHLIMAEQARVQLGLDKVYFLPSHIPPHVDEKKTIDANIRVEMTRLAIQDNIYFDIETIELERKEKSYTYDTIQLLKKQNPNTEYYFIIGGDMVDYLPTWHRVDELVHEVQFVGVERPGYEKETPYPVLWITAPKMDISSTQIRKNVLFQQSIKYLVPELVEAYIAEKGLYLE